MKRSLSLCGPVLFVVLMAAHCLGQSSGTPRFELGAQFTGIHLPVNSNFGVGGRVVYNFNSYFSLEGEMSWLLKDSPPTIRSGGNIQQGLFGVKAGLRNDKFGVFAKVRPGYISFSNSVLSTSLTLGPGLLPAITQNQGRLTQAALDVGSVMEFYPTRHWTVRTDVGDTMVFYQSTPFFNTTLFTLTLPGQTQNNFQFSTGIHYRF